MFVLLEYREHDELGVVHRNWLTPKKREVYWPPYKIKSIFDKAILKGEPVGSKWELYPVERIFNTYDNYKEAQRKAIIAERTSDLQTEADEEDDINLNKRRRIKRPLRYIDDSDNEEVDKSSDDDQQSALSRPPLINLAKVKHFTPLTEKILDSSSINLSPNSPAFDVTLTNTSSRFIPVPTVTSTPYCEPRSTTSSSSRASSFGLLEELGTQCKECSTYSTKYLNILSTLIQQNTEILGILKNQSHILPQITETSLRLPVEFPIKSLEDLEVVENYLQHKDNEEKLTAYLASLDKTSLTSSTNAALRFVLSYQVAKEFSFFGTRDQKKAFNNFRIKKTIVAAIKSSIPSATEREVEDQIKSWLKRSPKIYSLQQQKSNRRVNDGI